MKTLFKHVALIGKHRTHVEGALAQESRLVLERVATFLHASGCVVTLEAATAQITNIHIGQPFAQFLDLAQIGQQCDVAVVVGGDGTMLDAARQLAPYKIPMLGINQGRLGFITDITLDEMARVLAPMLTGDYDEEHRSMMFARVIRNGQTIYETLALNDVVVGRIAASGMVELHVEVDGHFVANHLADGLIVASSTGSTAYSLSAGGPILHPHVASWVLAPIAPHTLSNRPIVLPDSSTVALVVQGARSTAGANFDMLSFAPLHHGDRVEVRRAEHVVRLLHPRGWNYYDTLRKKLHWNEGTRP